MNDLERYHRQMLLGGIGEDGQRKLRDSTAMVVGCGALGGVIAESLCRAGVGRLILLDRDVVELTNLQRQVLFDEADAAEGKPKAIAARDRLSRVNSGAQLDAHVTDLNASNADRLAAEADVLMDGTDNFETRYLLNDLAVKRGLPYVYGGAVATGGMVYPVLPHTAEGHSDWERARLAGPCLRCVFPEAPAAGAGPTCDTAGVLGPVVSVVASLQAAEAIKLLTGNLDAVSRSLVQVDPWQGMFRQVDLSEAYELGRCVCCGGRRFEYLEGQHGTKATTLCGRGAVQVRAGGGNGFSGGASGATSGGGGGASGGGGVDLVSIAERLSAHGEVISNEHLLRVELTERGQSFKLTLFPDGRAIVHGTSDPAEAKGLYARYVGL